MRAAERQKGRGSDGGNKIGGCSRGSHQDWWLFPGFAERLVAVPWVYREIGGCSLGSQRDWWCSLRRKEEISHSENGEIGG